MEDIQKQVKLNEIKKRLVELDKERNKLENQLAREADQLTKEAIDNKQFDKAKTILNKFFKIRNEDGTINTKQSSDLVDCIIVKDLAFARINQLIKKES